MPSIMFSDSGDLRICKAKSDLIAAHALSGCDTVAWYRVRCGT